MSRDVVVKLDGVGKKFCLSLKRSLWYGVKDLFSALNPFGTDGLPASGYAVAGNGSLSDSDGLRRDEFWAVRDVSFELRRGECLGLIGRNGAGKTTLLRMLNGLIKPDRGRIEMRGRVGALIALGAGFNPILTGRENIYVSAAVLGLSKVEVDRRFDEIVNFAEVADFIDTPVQNYSSGMAVRLGFAVAAHLEPDILMVDEVLAVGDMEFQAKCLDYVSRLCERGCTVILVSHNEELVRRVCRHGLLLQKGRALFNGDINGCYSQYHSLSLEGWIGESRRAGNGKVEIRNVEFLDGFGISQKSFQVGHAMTIRVHLVPKERVEDPIVDIGFNSNLGYVASSIHSKFSGQTLGFLEAPTIVEIHIPRLHIAPGGYRMTALVGAPDLLEIYDWRRNSWDILIEHDTYVRGAVWMPTEWKVIRGRGAT